MESRIQTNQLFDSIEIQKKKKKIKIFKIKNKEIFSNFSSFTGHFFCLCISYILGFGIFDFFLFVSKKVFIFINQKCAFVNKNYNQHKTKMAQNIDALVEQFNKLSSDVQGGNLENAHKLLESLKLPVASLPYPSANVSVDEMKRRLMLGSKKKNHHLKFNF